MKTLLVTPEQDWDTASKNLYGSSARLQVACTTLEKRVMLKEEQLTAFSQEKPILEKRFSTGRSKSKGSRGLDSPAMVLASKECHTLGYILWLQLPVF